MDKQIIRFETEVDCYGFSLEQFKLEGRILAKKTLENCIDNFKNKLIEKLENANASPETIAKLNEYQFNDLCMKIFNSFEAQFKNFDELVERAFSLSENMIYGCYESCSKFTEADEEFLKNEIQECELWYMQNKYMLLAMKTELESYKDLEPVILKEAQLVQHLENVLEIFQNDCKLNDSLIETINVFK
ncbi:uncharacterized protein LOC129613281 [Condylostylus longicornis]|uniref:uncharacterized protein LOC129613281 n=1 Tax=Condylostylus longicornis TaxID=2530218 RepID=UPI00244D9AB0|nr:uncharacterized protein LOC129613281 [Condylostylus longicornis]